jgi:hypothetical protein
MGGPCVKGPDINYMKKKKGKSKQCKKILSKGWLLKGQKHIASKRIFSFKGKKDPV